METKWIVIGVVSWFACMFLGMGLSEYYNHECRMAAMQADYSKEAIKELCK
jgi:hypothetical protein